MSKQQQRIRSSQVGVEDDSTTPTNAFVASASVNATVKPVPSSGVAASTTTTTSTRVPPLNLERLQNQMIHAAVLSDSNNTIPGACPSPSPKSSPTSAGAMVKIQINPPSTRHATLREHDGTAQQGYEEEDDNIDDVDDGAEDDAEILTDDISSEDDEVRLSSIDQTLTRSIPLSCQMVNPRSGDRKTRDEFKKAHEGVQFVYAIQLKSYDPTFNDSAAAAAVCPPDQRKHFKLQSTYNRNFSLVFNSLRDILGGKPDPLTGVKPFGDGAHYLGYLEQGYYDPIHSYIQVSASLEQLEELAENVKIQIPGLMDNFHTFDQELKGTRTRFAHPQGRVCPQIIQTFYEWRKKRALDPEFKEYHHTFDGDRPDILTLQSAVFEDESIEDVLERAHDRARREEKFCETYLKEKIEGWIREGASNEKLLGMEVKEQNNTTDSNAMITTDSSNAAASSSTAPTALTSSELADKELIELGSKKHTKGLRMYSSLHSMGQAIPQVQTQASIAVAPPTSTANTVLDLRPDSHLASHGAQWDSKEEQRHKMSNHGSLPGMDGEEDGHWMKEKEKRKEKEEGVVVTVAANPPPPSSSKLQPQQQQQLLSPVLPSSTLGNGSSRSPSRSQQKNMIHRHNASIAIPTTPTAINAGAGVNVGATTDTQQQQPPQPQTYLSIPECTCNLFVPYQKEELVRMLIERALDQVLAKLDNTEVMEGVVGDGTGGSQNTTTSTSTSSSTGNGLRELKRRKVIKDIFPLHYEIDSSFYKYSRKDILAKFCNVRRSYVSAFSFLESSRIFVSWMRDYFGEKIGMYFAFLHFYNNCTLYLSVLGLVPGIWSYINGADNISVIIYCIIIMLWSAFFVKFWNRQSNDYSFEWNMLDYEQNEGEMDSFLRSLEGPQGAGNSSYGFYEIEGRWVDMTDFAIQAKLSRDEHILKFVPRSHIDTSGKCHSCFFSWYGGTSEHGALERSQLNANVYRYAKEFFGWTVITTLIGCVFTSIVSLILLKLVLIKIMQLYGQIIAGVSNGLVIFLLDAVYKRLAIKLTEWENHRTITQFEEKLTSKCFVFQFVNSYFSLFYIAFFKSGYKSTRTLLGYSDICKDGNGDPDSNCMTELSSALMTIILTRLGIALVTQRFLPKYLTKLSLARLKVKLKLYQQLQSGLKMTQGLAETAAGHVAKGVTGAAGVVTKGVTGAAGQVAKGVTGGASFLKRELSISGMEGGGLGSVKSGRKEKEEEKEEEKKMEEPTPSATPSITEQQTASVKQQRKRKIKRVASDDSTAVVSARSSSPSPIPFLQTQSPLSPPILPPPRKHSLELPSRERRKSVDKGANSERKEREEEKEREREEEQKQDDSVPTVSPIILSSNDTLLIASGTSLAVSATHVNVEPSLNEQQPTAMIISASNKKRTSVEFVPSAVEPAPLSDEVPLHEDAAVAATATVDPVPSLANEAAFAASPEKRSLSSKPASRTSSFKSEPSTNTNSAELTPTVETHLNAAVSVGAPTATDNAQLLPIVAASSDFESSIAEDLMSDVPTTHDEEQKEADQQPLPSTDNAAILSAALTVESSSLDNEDEALVSVTIIPQHDGTVVVDITATESQSSATADVALEASVLDDSIFDVSAAATVVAAISTDVITVPPPSATVTTAASLEVADDSSDNIARLTPLPDSVRESARVQEKNHEEDNSKEAKANDNEIPSDLNENADDDDLGDDDDLDDLPPPPPNPPRIPAPSGEIKIEVRGKAQLVESSDSNNNTSNSNQAGSMLSPPSPSAGELTGSRRGKAAAFFSSGGGAVVAFGGEIGGGMQRLGGNLFEFTTDVFDKFSKIGDMDRMSLEYQAIQPKYAINRNVLGTFDDYNELVIGYGYMVMFAAAFPICPAITLVHNIIQNSTHGFKLIKNYQKPKYYGATDIGMFWYLLVFLTAMSVGTNTAIICFTSTQIERYFPEGDVTLLTRISVSMILEHIFGLAVYLVLANLSDFRPSLRVQLAFNEQVKDIENDYSEYIELKRTRKEELAKKLREQQLAKNRRKIDLVKDSTKVLVRMKKFGVWKKEERGEVVGGSNGDGAVVDEELGNAKEKQGLLAKFGRAKPTVHHHHSTAAAPAAETMHDGGDHSGFAVHAKERKLFEEWKRSQQKEAAKLNQQTKKKDYEEEKENDSSLPQKYQPTIAIMPMNKKQGMKEPILSSKQLKATSSQSEDQQQQQHERSTSSSASSSDSEDNISAIFKPKPKRVVKGGTDDGVEFDMEWDGVTLAGRGKEKDRDDNESDDDTASAAAPSSQLPSVLPNTSSRLHSIQRFNPSALALTTEYTQLSNPHTLLSHIYHPFVVPEKISEVDGEVLSELIQIGTQSWRLRIRKLRESENIELSLLYVAGMVPHYTSVYLTTRHHADNRICLYRTFSHLYTHHNGGGYGFPQYASLSELRQSGAYKPKKDTLEFGVVFTDGMGVGVRSNANGGVPSGEITGATPRSARTLTAAASMPSFPRLLSSAKPRETHDRGSVGLYSTRRDADDDGQQEEMSSLLPRASAHTTSSKPKNRPIDLAPLTLGLRTPQPAPPAPTSSSIQVHSNNNNNDIHDTLNVPIYGGARSNNQYANTSSFARSIQSPQQMEEMFQLDVRTPGSSEIYSSTQQQQYYRQQQQQQQPQRAPMSRTQVADYSLTAAATPSFASTQPFFSSNPRQLQPQRQMLRPLQSQQQPEYQRTQSNFNYSSASQPASTSAYQQQQYHQPQYQDPTLNEIRPPLTPTASTSFSVTAPIYRSPYGYPLQQQQQQQQSSYWRGY